MKTIWAKVALAAFVLGAAGTVAHASPQPQEPAGAYDQQGWDVPPHEFREVQRKGFHDGIEGARKDFDHHRAPNVEGREEYRHPHVDAAMRDDYREGFRRGYDAAMQHLEGH